MSLPSRHRTLALGPRLMCHASERHMSIRATLMRRLPHTSMCGESIEVASYIGAPGIMQKIPRRKPSPFVPHSPPCRKHSPVVPPRRSGSKPGASYQRFLEAAPRSSSHRFDHSNRSRDPRKSPGYGSHDTSNPEAIRLLSLRGIQIIVRSLFPYHNREGGSTP